MQPGHHDSMKRRICLTVTSAIQPVMPVWPDDAEGGEEPHSIANDESERRRAGLSPAADNGAIGEKLYVGGATVRTHVTHILGKLEARSRVQPW
jgi:hypothetical protein